MDLQGLITSFFSVWAATPLCVLPAKETIEEILFKDRKMTFKENVVWTLIIITICHLLALFIPSIGDAMTLAGCTTNPMVILNEDHFFTDWIYHSSLSVLEGS